MKSQQRSHLPPRLAQSLDRRLSRRRALTVTLRPRFAEIGQLLKKMDRLVLRFRRTEPGAAFAGAWTTSRIIRDLGGSAPAEPEPAVPAA